MARGVLTYREILPAQGSQRGVLIALHDYGGTCAQLVPLCRSLDSGLRILAPEAPRPIFIRSHLYRHSGHTWYIGQEPLQPEPATFGDALHQIEGFLLDVYEQEDHGVGTPIYLMGQGQGGILAISLALLWPELLGGVVAVDACLPMFNEWPFAEATLNGLRFLLIHTTAASPEIKRQTTRTVDTLEAAGGKPVVKELDTGINLEEVIRQGLNS